MMLGTSRCHHLGTGGTDVINQIQPKGEHTITHNAQTQRKKCSKSSKREEISLF